MSTPIKRLGRGLSSLIQVTSGDKNDPQAVIAGPSIPEHAQSAQATAAPPPPTLPNSINATSYASRATYGSTVAPPIRLDQIVPGRHQPRREFNPESIGQLAASIARHGLVQPLVVRPLRERRGDTEVIVNYELVAGERRWRASRAAGIEAVPVIVREADDQQALELALIENLQREDLNAIDRAEAYSRYCREFGVKPEDLAFRLNEDRTTVINYLRLLELPSTVKDLVAVGTLSMGHARSLLGVTNPDERVALARSVVDNGLSVRALEEVVRRRREGGHDRKPAAVPPPNSSRDVSAHVVELEGRFQQALGTKVKIRPGRGKGRGKILIEYYSFDDFDRIMARMGVPADS